MKYLSSGVPRIEYILGLLIALVISDGLMTDFIVINGFGWEFNPVLQRIVSAGNLLFVKAAGALLSAFILWDIYRRRPKLALIFSLSCVVFYTGIVYWNLAVFLVSRV